MVVSCTFPDQWPVGKDTALEKKRRLVFRQDGRTLDLLFSFTFRGGYYVYLSSFQIDRVLLFQNMPL